VPLLIEPREVKLTTRTGISVRRTIPHAKLKSIGAWCFVDHFGPTSQEDGMVVAAHPHTGLQTVTWMLEGVGEHRDSLGTIQNIAPGQLNLMTAGRGISHSEISVEHSGNMHAVQMWVALPESARNMQPEFEHRDDLPIIDTDVFKATVLVGEFLGQRAKTKVHTPMVGVELRLKANAILQIPIQHGFEYGVFVIDGSIAANEQGASRSELVYFETDEAARGIELRAAGTGATVLLLGGEPFGERILMWWNFIARTHDEIVEQREQWNRHLEEEAARQRFGVFEDRIGGWIPAPELPTVRLNPR
jgi:redox-sensitive bicupin YhaK (pirin superfamily)